MAERSGKSMLGVLDEAVDAYRRKQFFAEANAAYEALRADPEEWARYQEEIEEWDSTLMDGLEDEPSWSASELVAPTGTPLPRLLEMGRAAAAALQSLLQTGEEAAQGLACSLRQIFVAPPMPVATLGSPSGAALPVLDRMGTTSATRRACVEGPRAVKGELSVRCRLEGTDAAQYRLRLLLRVPMPEGELPISPDPVPFLPDEGGATAELRFPLGELSDGFRAFEWVVAPEHWQLFLQPAGK